MANNADAETTLPDTDDDNVDNDDDDDDDDSATRTVTWLLEKTAGSLSTTRRRRHFDWSMLTKLNLPGCNLTELPPSLPHVVPNLSILFCPQNKFVEVPAIVGQCPKLQMISFKECRTVERIHPQALQPQLRWLILTGNRIRSIPSTISRCTRLQKCMLSGNRIQRLTADDSVLESLTNLELIRLACNDLTEPPPLALLKLPNLRWAAFASNPFLTVPSTNSSSINNNSNNDDDDDDDHDTKAMLPILDDPTLDDTSWPVLGQGAGGVTRQVTWKAKNNQPKEGEAAVVVAVKLYAGELTSDGSPQDEKAIAVHAARALPNEPALIKVLGETKRKGGLVMEFLHHFEALAGPPSLDTCSRDVYTTVDVEKDDEIDTSSSPSSPSSTPNNQRRISPAFAWKIATCMLRVLHQLHQLGICHGDFYAHNILIRRTTEEVKLSDFGAAFFYDRNAPYSQWMERVELRSYAVLVRELYEHYIVGAGAATAMVVDEDSMQLWKELLDASEKPEATFAALADQFAIVAK